MPSWPWVVPNPKKFSTYFMTLSLKTSAYTYLFFISVKIRISGNSQSERRSVMSWRWYNKQEGLEQLQACVRITWTGFWRKLHSKSWRFFISSTHFCLTSPSGNVWCPVEHYRLVCLWTFTAQAFGQNRMERSSKWCWHQVSKLIIVRSVSISFSLSFSHITAVITSGHLETGAKWKVTSSTSGWQLGDHDLCVE